MMRRKAPEWVWLCERNALERERWCEVMRSENDGESVSPDVEGRP